MQFPPATRRPYHTSPLWYDSIINASADGKSHHNKMPRISPPSPNSLGTQRGLLEPNRLAERDDPQVLARIRTCSCRIHGLCLDQWSIQRSTVTNNRVLDLIEAKQIANSLSALVEVVTPRPRTVPVNETKTGVGAKFGITLEQQHTYEESYFVVRNKCCSIRCLIKNWCKNLFKLDRL